jgi:hypothetical protein
MSNKQHGFNLIWNWLSQYHNRHSSAWWFFLLTPRQPEGFGPKQMMFTLLTRVGEEVTINGQQFAGLDLQQATRGSVEKFDSMMVGWIHDGRELHEAIIHEGAPATLSQDGSLSAWLTEADGRRLGCEMRAEGDKPYNIQADFTGQRGYGRFEVWGDERSETSAPWDTLDLTTPFGGSRVVAWRHLNFAGEFASPSGVEWLEGAGYFQRVCLDFPAFPWKWVWAVFEDESVFSCFAPYLGLHALRRGDRFMPGWLERAALPIKPSGYISLRDKQGVHQMTLFEKISVTPLLNGRRKTEFPHFHVHCRSKNGDFIQYLAIPHAHTEFIMDRPVLAGLWQSRFNYNEYLFRIHNLSGQINGRPLERAKLGAGFGNCEYTWGVGL